MKTAAAVAKRRVPNFMGTPGELIVQPAAEVARLEFAEKKSRISLYDGLLEQLAAATDAIPVGGAKPVLKFGSLKARPSITLRAKKKGLLVSFAETGDVLYVRLEGRVGDEARKTRRAAILRILKTSVPLNAGAIAVRLREQGDGVADAGLVEALLGVMVKAGEVVSQEGGKWRIAPGKA